MSDTMLVCGSRGSAGLDGLHRFHDEANGMIVECRTKWNQNT